MTTTTAPQVRSTFVPTFFLGRFASKVANLVKLAEKLGVEPISYVETGRRMVTETENGFEFTFEVVDIDVTGILPKLPGGWEYLGTVEHAAAGNLIHGENEIVESFRTAGPDCVHCGLRRNRSKTVIVRSESGEIAQVGSTCLKDFLGYHGSPDALAAYAESLDDEGDEGLFSRTFRDAVPTEAILKSSAAVIRVEGWHPKSFSGISTADLVRCALRLDKPTEAEKEILKGITVEQADEEVAAGTLAWARNELDGANEYLGNLRVVLGADFVDTKHVGLAVSSVSAWLRHVEKLAVYSAQKAARATSEFVGTVGKRETFEVEVIAERAIDSDYGITYLISMVDGAGNILKTFSSGEFGRCAEVGEKLTIKGTVKAHEVYNGANETSLSRVAVVS